MNPNNTNTLAVREPQTLAAYDPTNGAMSAASLLGQVKLIQEIMGATMRDGEHFGKIPGCGDKPTLLKPGAEKLCLVFRFAPAYEVGEAARENGHREYRVTTTLRSMLTGAVVGQGIGICSTLESKYRYRGSNAEVTDRPVPRAYWDLRQEDPAKAQELIGGKGFTTKRVEGQGWMIAKAGEKAENPDIADTYNTVLKMAKKRALVDAVLTATAASDIFTQDLEDVSANLAHARQEAAGTVTVEPAVPRAKAATTPRRASVPADLGNANGSNAYRGQSEGDDAPDEPAAGDGQVRIHFGKNRGLAWSELSPNQRGWYQDDWAKTAKKKGAKLLSADDRALLAALDEMVAGTRNPETGAMQPATEAAPDAGAEEDDEIPM